MDVLVFILIGTVLAFALIFARHSTSSFHAQTAADYEEGHPNFVLKEHLNGKMVCEGAIYGPMGRVTSTFSADFDIHWDGDTGVMDELFRYNDGSKQTRQWRITTHRDGRFELEADDVPGGGAGIVAGHAVQMRYPITLPEDAGGHTLRCTDWMYLTPDGTVMNRNQFRKFGFKVAELIATIRPKDPT